MEPVPSAPDELSDPIQQIAESLIEGTDRTERLLLSKSLQETLFYCIGFNPELRYPEVRRRIKQSLAREGTAAILQRFLTFHFFNFVWFQIGESFRAIAWTSSDFERDMETVEALCQKAVSVSWKTSSDTNKQLTVTAARQLARAIEDRLRSGA
jgi:hypothetical protein